MTVHTPISALTLERSAFVAGQARNRALLLLPMSRTPALRLNSLAVKKTIFKGESEVPKALDAFMSASLRRLRYRSLPIVFLFVIVAGLPLAAQDDITHRKTRRPVQWLIHHRPGLESVELPERALLWRTTRQPGTL